MDPLTQGVLGVTASQLVASPRQKVFAAVAGFFSGAAADLDVLLKSSTDPLLALEYHRQFTHSLIFIPIGALLCASFFFVIFFRGKISFRHTYLFCFAGYATHALLDACTTYGTQLFWPFSNARIAWNNVSVVDPLFTLPLMLLVLVSILRRSTGWALCSMLFAVSYLLLGAVQNHRATLVAAQLADSRGHVPVSLGVKPSFANIITWKSVYEYQGRYYVDAIRVLSGFRVIEGASTEKLDLAKHFSWLDQSSQQARDVERFRWFSNQHLGLDPRNPQRIIDIRYSLIPNRMDGMWGITLSPGAERNEHVKWSVMRPRGEQLKRNIAMLWSMIKA